MDLYHSRLTQDDLNDLVIKYKISCDLHPRLTSEEFMMFEISDDAIGIYHRMFDFSSVRIAYSSFLLPLIKHYRVHFSQLGPLGLNKVITFKVLCRSLQIEPTVTLLRVFQTLCEQAGILDSMVRRHPSTVINDPRPVVGSFSMVDVCRLSVQVVKLRDMPEGVLVLYGLRRVWKSYVCDSVLWGADGNVMGIYDFLCFLEWTGAEDLVVGTTSSKILAKAEASQKRKASTSGATSSHVEKHTRSALAQSSGSTTCPSLFVSDDDRSDDDDDEDDACVEILDISRDVIHRDFFPFSVGPYYATYPEGGVAGNYQFPTLGEMVWVESLYDDQLTTKMSMLHCMMMSYGGELLTHYRGLNQSHHEYVLSVDSTIKGFEEKVAILTGLEHQVSTLKKQGLVSKFLAFDECSRVEGELLSLAASAELEHGLSMHQTKDEFAVVLKKMANFILGAHDRLAKASSLVARTDYAFLNKISEHATNPLSVILQLEPKKLARPANVPTSRDARVSLLLQRS
ncbi:hypothetical protein Tco_0473145 [Tanacetum coccineum]